MADAPLAGFTTTPPGGGSPPPPPADISGNARRARLQVLPLGHEPLLRQGQARRSKQSLCAGFVRRKGTGKHPGSHVRDPQHLEHALQTAILADGAMRDRKCHIRGLTLQQRRCVRAQLHQTRLLPTGHERAGYRAPRTAAYVGFAARAAHHHGNAQRLHSADSAGRWHSSIPSFSLNWKMRSSR